MATIDERVVSLKFNNGQFQSAAQSTMDMLGKLQSSLNFKGSTSGLEEVATAAKSISLEGLNAGIETSKAKFDTLKVVGLAALATIAAKATSAGIDMAKSFANDAFIKAPKEGLAEYELKIGSIQTILANTSKHGTKLKEVTSVLDDLNAYSDKTIYNFADMTRNIGLFTNAGIGIQDAADMIKGFSNEAAASGTKAADASHAAYQLSQALSAGKITLMDWRSLTNVGMGNKNMQTGITEIATAMGTFKGKGTDATKVAKDFNGSLEKGWLTADVMQNYLKIQAGELSDAQMKSIGLNAKQITAFKEQAKIAEDAATKVRTFTQMMETQGEVVGSGWAETWEIILGDFDQATAFFTPLSDILTGFAKSSSDARNGMLQMWAAAGGREALMNGILNIFKAIEAIMKPFKEAFAAAFPPSGNSGLAAVTKGFEKLTAALILTEGAAKVIKAVMTTIFNILKIGGLIIGGILGVIGTLIGALFTGGDGMSDYGAVIVSVFDTINKALANTAWIAPFFSNLGKVLSAPIVMLRQFGDAVFEAVGNLDLFSKIGPALSAVAGFIGDFAKNAASGLSAFVSGGLEGALTRVRERLESIADFGDIAKAAWDGFVSGLRGILGIFEPLISAIGKMFSDIGDNIARVFTDVDFNQGLDVLNTGLLAGLVIMIKLFFTKVLGMGDGVKEGLLDKIGGLTEGISGSFGALTGTLEAMQTNLKADTLIKIAGAIALLTASVVVLSMIDSNKLTAALVAMTVMFTQLGVSMKVFEGIMIATDLKSMALLGIFLVMIANAILILSVAVTVLSKLKFGELMKGLLGVFTLLMSVALAAKIMAPYAANLITTGIGLMAVAVAVRILAGAVKTFSDMNFGEMMKGLLGVGATLVALALFTRIVKVSKGAFAASAGLILLGIALKIIATAVKDFADIDNGSLVKGLVTITLVLTALAVFSKATSKVGNIFGVAAGMIVLGVAMKVMASALSDFGSMDVPTLVKGLIGLAGALGIIAIAMNLMPPTMIATAAALVIVGAALHIISGAMKSLGEMSVGEIIKSIVMLAASLTIIAIATTAMVGALPGAAALLVVSAALWTLAPVLVILGGMAWPAILTGLGALALLFAVIGVAGLLLTPVVPTLVLFGAAVLLLGVGIQAAGIGLGLFAAGLMVLATIGQIAIPMLVNLIQQLANTIPYVLIKFGEGIAALTAIVLPALVTVVATIIATVISVLLNSVPKLVEMGLLLLLGILIGIRDNIYQVVVVAYDIIIGLLRGLRDKIPGVARAGTEVILAFLAALRENIPQLVQAGWDTLIAFIDGITDGVNNNMERLRSSGRALAFALADGVTGGLFTKLGEIKAKVGEMASGILEKMRGVFDINSPSRVTRGYGMSLGEGLNMGMDRMMGSVNKTAGKIGSGALTAINGSMSGITDSLNGDINYNPTIRPVLDLTSVKKDAAGISGMLGNNTIDTSVSNRQAQVISDNMKRSVEMESTQSKGDTILHFEQTNNSPKALSDIEIYRNTNNQLSQAREVLKV